MLNDDGVDGDDGFFYAAKIEAEGVAMEFDVPGENPYRIVGHGTRIQEGLGAGDGGYAMRHAHASLSNGLRRET